MPPTAPRRQAADDLATPRRRRRRSERLAALRRYRDPRHAARAGARRAHRAGRGHLRRRRSRSSRSWTTSRQWFKSRVSASSRTETRRDVAFCAHVLDQRTPLVVPDASLDPRFAGNPLVTGPDGIRFYAGAPLTTRAGHVLGALASWTECRGSSREAQVRGLSALSRQVMTQLETRRQADELRERETRLQESEERFSRIFYSSPTALFIARLRDGSILDVNDAFERMTGHLRAHCLGRTIAELGLITEDAREALRALLTSSGSLSTDGVPFRNSAGEHRLAIGSAELIPLKGEPHVVAMIIDATEIKRAEASLRESEQRLRLALDAAHMGTFDWDMTTGRITWSPATRAVGPRARHVRRHLRGVRRARASRRPPAAQRRSRAVRGQRASRSSASSAWSGRTARCTGCSAAASSSSTRPTRPSGCAASCRTPPRARPPRRCCARTRSASRRRSATPGSAAGATCRTAR